MEPRKTLGEILEILDGVYGYKENSPLADRIKAMRRRTEELQPISIEILAKLLASVRGISANNIQYNEAVVELMGEEEALAYVKESAITPHKYTRAQLGKWVHKYIFQDLTLIQRQMSVK